MPGKKAHKPREPKDAAKTAPRGSRKSSGLTEGHYERDPKRRTGHFTGAGEAALKKG
ncbi:MAG: hypothetical protein IT158_16235 [Bryobacterales bacterium]|nr:hypothetical protein [Bryobacterales bacterium]